VINPYVIIAAMVLWATSMFGAYHYGESRKADAIAAETARVNKAVAQASDALELATAKAIAQIQPQNVELQQETLREIRSHTFYESCKHPPVQLQRINDALTGAKRAEPAGGRVVPRADAGNR
jgi:hypothetical protein